MNDIHNNPEKPKLNSKGKTVATKYGYLRSIWGAYSKEKSISHISCIVQNPQKMENSKFQKNLICVGKAGLFGSTKYIWLDRNRKNAITEICLFRGSVPSCEEVAFEIRFDGFKPLDDNSKLYL
eukprot:531409_1